MTRIYSLALVAAVAACGGGGGGNGDDTDPPITGMITEDAVWSGTVHMTGFVTIAPGVTVTVEPGTAVQVAAATSVTVQGTLDVQGEPGGIVTIGPEIADQHWLGIGVEGTYTLRYGVQTGGGIFTTRPESVATVTDSELRQGLGDFLVMTDGTLDVQYSNVGLDAEAESTHCNVHIDHAVRATFSHNNNVGVAYGLMLYAGTLDATDFTHNNWSGNHIDVEQDLTGAAHFDESYFADGQPADVPGSTFDNLATAPLTDVGPRL